MADSSDGSPSSKSFQYNDTGVTPIGATGGSETRPKNVALVYCIKT
jgi:hypothetical protein